MGPSLASQRMMMAFLLYLPFIRAFAISLFFKYNAFALQTFSTEKLKLSDKSFCILKLVRNTAGMGNCLVLEDKVIKVMKTDGKILEYQAPIKVQQVLSDFSGHALSDSFSGLQHLRPDAKLLGGQLYYLIPIPSPSQKSKKKKVRFSDPEVTDEQGSPAGVVRIKLVISKQELQELLQKEGVSVRDVVSQIQSKESTKAMDTSESDGGDDCRGWKPVLESIAEAN